MITVTKTREAHIIIEMSEEELQELRSELHSWDGLIELGPVAAALLAQLMACP